MLDQLSRELKERKNFIRLIGRGKFYVASRSFQWKPQNRMKVFSSKLAQSRIYRWLLVHVTLIDFPTCAKLGCNDNVEADPCLCNPDNTCCMSSCEVIHDSSCLVLIRKELTDLAAAECSAGLQASVAFVTAAESVGSRLALHRFATLHRQPRHLNRPS